MKTCKRGHTYESMNCSECRKIRYTARKDQENAGNREWIKNNKDRYKKKQKEYREARPELKAALYADWQKRNPVHSVWRSMKNRCYSEKCRAYARYGGRGIVICERWLGENGYKNFESDMGPRPSLQHTIERVNNNGNYEPGNCKWASRAQQQRNRRNNVMLTINGKTQCLKDWAIETGICYKTLQGRVKLGWPESRWLEVPDPSYWARIKAGIDRNKVCASGTTGI